MERTSQLLNEGYDLDIAVENCIRKVNADLNWDSIIGQKDAKEALRQTLEYPHRFSWFYRGKTVPPQGVLLYGPPGVAKTKMAEVAASVSGSVLVEVRASSIRSKFYGESEKFIKALFAKVSGMEKAIIFIDEMDDLLSSRDHQSSSIGDGIINEFLVEMTGNIPLEERKFVIIGATNFPHKIDIAIRRRFQKQVRLHMPTQVDRCDMFQTFLKDAMHNLEKTDFQLLAKLSDG
jgi:SpoVK/Ycf46/Vps4 family AAA+-type ATPase